MLGMRQIGFETSFVLECDEETVREAIIESFRTYILTPFISSDRVDLLCKFTEGDFKAMHLLRRGAVLEFKEHNMAVRSIRGGGEGGHSG